MFIQKISNVTYIDIEGIFSSIKESSSVDKIKAFLKTSGVMFYDDENNFVKVPSLWICWFGGVPFTFWESSTLCFWDDSISPTNIAKWMNKMRAIWGFMSYLNNANRTTQEMVDGMKNLWHQSTEHMMHLNILIAGLSTSVENEFNSQRDLVHLARITEARTNIQNDPPLVVLDIKLLPYFQAVKKFISNNRPEISIELFDKKDHLEATNLIHPAAKATAIVLSWSIRNFKKIVAMKDDSGKELEFRRIVAQLDELLSAYCQ
jgi:hypothetical protein